MQSYITGLCAIGLSGTNLTITMIINMSILGVNLISRSQFPLLSTIQSSQVADFLERLDVFFMIASIIGVFFKVCVYFCAVVISTSSLFKISSPSRLAYPLGFIIMVYSIAIASNFEEFLYEGTKIVPLVFFLPF